MGLPLSERSGHCCNFTPEMKGAFFLIGNEGGKRKQDTYSIFYLTCKMSEPLLLKSLLPFLCNYDREAKISVKNVNRSFKHVLSGLLHFYMLTFSVM